MVILVSIGFGVVALCLLVMWFALRTAFSELKSIGEHLRKHNVHLDALKHDQEGLHTRVFATLDAFRDRLAHVDSAAMARLRMDVDDVLARVSKLWGRIGAQVAREREVEEPKTAAEIKAALRAKHRVAGTGITINGEEKV